MGNGQPMTTGTLNDVETRLSAMPRAFAGLLVVPTVLAALALGTMSRDLVGGISLLAIVLGAGALVVVWLRAFAIVVKDGWVEMRSLSRCWRMRVADVTSADLVKVPLSERGLTRPPVELVLSGRGATGESVTVSLNASVFDPELMENLLRVIRSRPTPRDG